MMKAMIPKYAHRLIVASLCLIWTQPTFAGINLCIDSKGNTVYTDNSCPHGFTIKTETQSAVDAVSPVQTPKPEQKSKKISWEKYQISMEDIELSWRLVLDATTNSAIIYPQVEFTVSNSGNEAVSRLKIILLFKDKNNKNLGDTFQYVKTLPGGEKSEKIVMSPSRGYFYDKQNDHNDYKKNLIVATELKVEIMARYMGEKSKIAILDFSSDVVE